MYGILSMSVGELIVVLLMVILCFGFRSPLSPLLCFITVFLIICISLCCFTDKVEDPYADRTYGKCVIWSFIKPRGYKTFFMLNSAEHEIFSANKYENANNSWHFHIY